MILFEDVSKMYRGAPKPALSNVSVDIGAGEFVFLVGASGSGKSSFLRLILKEERPSSGNVHVLGQDLRRIPSRKVPQFRRSLGVVFQDFRLLPQKTVFDNVAFSLRVIGKSAGFIHEAVPDILQTVGLAAKAKNFPHELSGGEQQRVAIARAAVNKPAIMLADEPTGNLDAVTGQTVEDLLFQMNQESGTTLVMVTHNSDLAARCQRVLRMDAGRLSEVQQHVA
jgi:cell division transport system ATP-binding protein